MSAGKLLPLASCLHRLMLLTTDVLALEEIDDQEGRCNFAPAFFVV